MAGGDPIELLAALRAGDVPMVDTVTGHLAATHLTLPHSDHLLLSHLDRATLGRGVTVAG